MSHPSENASRLAELVASRLLHDLASKMGAVAAGAELLEDYEPGGGMDSEALALLSQSARSATARLKLLRAAFGRIGGAGQPASGKDISVLLALPLSEAKITLDWPPEAVPSLDASAIRLVLLLILTAMDGLPRGGRLKISPGKTSRSLELLATGAGLRVDPEALQALSGSLSFEQAGPKSAPALMAQALAQAQGARLETQLSESEWRLHLSY